MFQIIQRVLRHQHFHDIIKLYNEGRGRINNVPLPSLYWVVAYLSASPMVRPNSESLGLRSVTGWKEPYQLPRLVRIRISI